MTSHHSDCGGLAAAGPYRDALERSRSRLGRLGSTAFYYPTIGSTNDAAAALARTGGCEGAVVVADEQTAGRGRRGHTWFSPPGAGLYVSVVLAPASACDPQRATQLLTLAAGVAVVEAVEETVGLAADLKWPNDVYRRGRKLAGIIAEALSSDVVGNPVVLGYGINVRAARYPPDLADGVTSLEAELGRTVDRAGLLVGTLTVLARRYDDLLAGRYDAILDAWRRRAPGAFGSRVCWSDPSGRRSGLTAGIDDDGALLVRVGECTERIVGGEVQW